MSSLQGHIAPHWKSQPLPIPLQQSSLVRAPLHSAHNLVAVQAAVSTEGFLRSVFPQLAAGEHMPTKAWHVEYEQVSLTRLRVTGLADLDVKEQESALARRREKCHVRAVLQGLDDETLAKPPRKRVRTKAPDCARALASKAHAEEATMEDMLEWDEELEAEAEPEAGSSEALVQLEVNQSITIPVAEAEDMRSARAAEDAIAAGPSAEPFLKHFTCGDQTGQLSLDVDNNINFRLYP